MSDDFSARYRLLKCVMVEDGIRTHNAQQVATGKVVMVHINDAAGPDEVDAIRAQLTQLSMENRNKVLETATLASGFAVVTEFLPGLQSFGAWLGRQKKSVESSTAEPLPAPETAPRPAIRVSFKRPDAASAPASGPAAAIALPPAVSEVKASAAPVAAMPVAALPVAALPVAALPIAALPVAAAPVAAMPVASSAVAATPLPPLQSDSLGAPPSADSFSSVFGSPVIPAPDHGPEYIRSGQPLPGPIGFSLHSDIKLKSTAPTGEAGMPVPSAPVTPPAPSVAGPGEFTMMFAPSAASDPLNPAKATSAPMGVAAIPVDPPRAPVTPPPFVAAPTQAPAAVSPPSLPPVAVIPPVPTAPSQFGWDTPAVAEAPTSKAPPGEFTMMFGAPATAAPLPEQVRQSPMHEAPPPTFSPLTPGQQLESPPVEPLHRVMSSSSPYAAGINQAGPSPIASNLSGGGYAGGAQYPSSQPPSAGLNYAGGAFGAGQGYQAMPEFAPAPPQPSYPPAHASPMVVKDAPGSVGIGSTPGILPPPIFSGGSSSPLSALGGAAPGISANAGPSEYTQLISNGAAPVVPELKPQSTKEAVSGSGRRRLPTGLIVVINVIILIAVLLIFFVYKQQIPNRARLMPAAPIMPNMPTAPKLPGSPPS